MRILLFTTADLVQSSGSGIRARLIAEGLRFHGAQIAVVSSSIPDSFCKIGISGYSLHVGQSWYDLLSEAVRSFKPDILFGITEGLADIVGKVAKLNNLPFVFDLHGIGVIEILELGRGHGSRRERLLNSLTWLSWVQKAHAVTVANPTMINIVRFFNKSTYPVVGITDVSHFTPHGRLASLGTDCATTNVLYAGNYLKWQGIELLFEAMAQLLDDNEPVSFTLIGSIAKNVRLTKDWQARYPNNSLNIIEYIPYDQMPAYYRAASVLVIPRPFMLSTYFAFPQKMADYMASGRTIVATDLAPHRWSLQNPSAGILCPTTASGLAQAIKKAMNPTLTESLGHHARNKAISSFCHLKQASKIYSLFENILKSR